MVAHGLNRLVSVSVLALLVVTPGLAAVCEAVCAVPHAAAAAAPSACHRAPSADRLTGAATDPCGTHEDGIADSLARPSSRELDAPPLQAAVAPSEFGAPESERTAVVTPRPIRPGPSRPPLVLRV